MKKRLFSILLAVTIVFITTACGSENSSSDSEISQVQESPADDNSTEENSKKYKIAYVVRDTGSIYSQYIIDFNEACELHNVEPLIISYENDTAKWPDTLENAITMGADAVYTWPDDQAMADFAGQYYKSEGTAIKVKNILLKTPGFRIGDSYFTYGGNRYRTLHSDDQHFLIITGEKNTIRNYLTFGGIQSELMEVLDRYDVIALHNIKDDKRTVLVQASNENQVIEILGVNEEYLVFKIRDTFYDDNEEIERDMVYSIDLVQYK